jgi:uncharacterized protein with ParB-like and HNH nuclease domain
MGDAEFRTIRGLLNEPNGMFRVPPYQRGYEWENDEWRDLWLDLNRIEQQGGTHFLGNVILLYKQQDKAFEIVDGQQRITTISILLMAIRDSNNWSGDSKDGRIRPLIGYKPGTERKRRLYLNDPEADASYEQIWKKIKEDGESQIREAYEYYTNKLQTLNDDEIDDLLDKTVDSLRIVRTKLEDPALAYPIFQSQNARGKEVPQHILATSRVHGEAHKLDSESEKKRVIQNWDNIYDELNESLGRPRFRPATDIPIRRPISHILSVSETKTLTRITRGELYENFERVINSYDNVSDFVDWFSKEKDIYLQIASSSDDVSGGRLSNGTKRYLQYLNCAPSHAEILSYILYKKFNNEKLLKEFFRLSSMFTMRFELADADNRKQKDEIYSAASKLKDTNDPSDVRHILKSKIRDDSPSDEKIRQNLNEERKMSMGEWRYRTRLILVSIEESRKSTKSLNLDKLHIDHISPRNTFSNDEYFEWRMRHEEDGFSDRCMKLGNLALLTESEHGQLKESSFTDKIQTYNNSDISTTRGIAKNFDEWDDEAIDKRTELMADELIKYWSLP